MTLLNQLKKLNKQGVNEHSPAPVEGVILRAGSNNTYDIKFRNGATALTVAGPVGLSIGASVLVTIYPGKQKRYVITGQGYRNIDSVTVVEV